MNSQVFYRKWRPQTFADVVGQEHITQTLLNALISSRVAHAYLFCGPRGTGKTSTGRILAKAVNCLTQGKGEPCNSCSMCQAITEGRAMDVVEIDAASNRGIDEIRELRERVNFAPNQARYKVYIIDEVHMLTEPASNALLKTLEEPPPHVIFILATTEPHRVAATIQSRCQRFDFRRIPQQAIVQRLERVCDGEGITADPLALRLIAKSATGSLRDVQNLLEQLVAYYGPEIKPQQVQAILGITSDWRVPEIAKHILTGDIAAGLTAISGVVNDGLDLRQFNIELVEYLRGVLLLKAGASEAANLSPEAMAEMTSLAARATIDQILKAVKLFGQLDLRFDSYSSLPMELALVECTLPGKEHKEAIAPPQAEELIAPAGVAEPVAASVPAPEPPLATAATDATSPQGAEVLERLRAIWKSVPEAFRGSKIRIGALLRDSCEPIAIEDNTVVVRFYYPFHKEMIEKVENRRVVEEVLSREMGSPYRMRCVLKARPKRPGAPSASEGHLVKAAMDMGAKVINVEENG